MSRDFSRNRHLGFNRLDGGARDRRDADVQAEAGDEGGVPGDLPRALPPRPPRDRDEDPGAVPVHRGPRRLLLHARVPGPREPRADEGELLRGPLWKNELEAKLMPMIEKYDVVVVEMESLGEWQ